MAVRDETVSFSLEVNVEKAYEDIRRVQTIAYRALDLLKQSGLLPEERARTLETIQRAIALANTLRLTLIAMQMATGPIGFTMAGLSIVSSMVATGDFIMEIEGH